MRPLIRPTMIPQQVPRLAVVFLLAVIGLVVARGVLIPETFGDIGHYRAAAIDSIVAHEKQYAGHQECALCHGPINELRLEGNHRGVACEVCHGASAAHVAGPMDVKPSAPRERALCPMCHAYNAARPTGFAQIDPVAHNPLTPCITCHEPHEPEPPAVPEDCSACHGQIARQKAVSHHATLPCTEERSFCGGCHAQDAPSPGRIPRVNLRSHGEGYPCWQCHYPHYPETGDD